MKKIFLGQNIKFFKYFDKKGIGSIPRIILSSFILVALFYSTPLFIEVSNKKNIEFQNNSKAVLAYTLNKKTNGLGDDNQILNEKDLLVDIFSLNELETDTVRLNASTIKQLFEDTNYSLDDKRKN